MTFFKKKEKQTVKKKPEYYLDSGRLAYKMVDPESKNVKNNINKSNQKTNDKPEYKWDEYPLGKIGISVTGIVLGGLALYKIKHYFNLF